MPQTFRVVQCHQCKAFQSDLEKKAKKWQCKLCGEKQSLQRVFARSHSNKDCRLVVQQYNEARGIAEQEAGELTVEAEEHTQQQPQQQQPQGQRWQAYQEEEEDEGWTVAVPERPVCKPKRGANPAAAASDKGGGKRLRQQHGASVEEAAHAGWDAAPCPKPLVMAQQDAQRPRQPLQQQQGNWGAGPESAARAGTTQPQHSWQELLPPVTAQRQQLQQQPLHGNASGWQQQPQPTVVPLQPYCLPSGGPQQQAKAPVSTKWDSWVTENDEW
ncbi:MRN complex-interacting protein [Chlorella vulgaris]